MLDHLTADTFLAHLGQMFTLHATATDTIDIELVRVTPLGETPAPGDSRAPRAPFSIAFKGPAQILLPQRIYAVEHAQLGRHSLFLVPLGPEQGGMIYEAVFG